MEEAPVVQKNIAAHLKFVKEHLDTSLGLFTLVSYSSCCPLLATSASCL